MSLFWEDRAIREISKANMPVVSPLSVPLITSSCFFLKVLKLFFFSFSFPLLLITDIDYSSLCYTVGCCCLFILYIMICICHPKLPAHPFLTSPSTMGCFYVELEGHTPSIPGWASEFQNALMWEITWPILLLPGDENLPIPQLT